MISRIFTLSVVVAVFCGVQGVAQERKGDERSTDYAQVSRLLGEAIRYEVQQKQLPAFSIALVDQDRIVWSDGFGFQDAEQKTPATAETIYRVGSVSKLFTDIAVMQLVEKNKLDLDVPVTRYLPEFQPNNPYDVPITLRQLMSHQSGLVRESPIGNYFDPDEPSLAETVASLNDTSLVYKPGTRTKYSNAAITVVGAVLEKQIGADFSQSIERSILKPLAMNNSSFTRTARVDESLADAQMWTYDGRRFEAPKFALGTAPAGNMYSDVNDLSKFMICLFNQGRAGDVQILRPETLREMTTPIKNSDGKPQGFGIGFQVQDFDGHAKIGHGGAVYGFSTQFEALTDRQIGVVAVSALDGSNGVTRRLCQYALRLMLAAQDGKPLPAYRTSGPVPPERARELVGIYENENQLASIVELGGALFLYRGSYRYRLRASSDDGSIVTDDVIGSGTKVRRDESGNLIVADKTFVRLDDAIPAQPPRGGLPDDAG